ncbi:MAG TPA: type II secretion system F family protein [Candidatus Limnocylindrales bacterium]|jgi:tight adherence protein C|nr:type II secretion system F family protein [Candidatus Limnocylindrales bacterium]
MLIPLILALAAAGGVLLIVAAVVGSRPMDPVQARLSQLGSMQARTLEEIELQQPFFERTVRPLLGRLTGFASRLASPKRVSRTDRRLMMAGNPGNLRTIDFLALKLLVAGIAGGIGFFVGLAMGGGFGMAAMFGPAAGVLGFMLPEIWLSRHIKERQRLVLLAVPDTLDLLTISVKAGLSFDGALTKVVEKTPGPLSDEFRRALAEVRVGRTRRDALRDLVERTNVQALTNFIGAIIQAEQLGVSISKVLQVQSEQLRIERRQRAEEMAAKAPIKMLFPLVGCIFPSIFIVLLAPAIILIMVNLG